MSIVLNRHHFLLQFASAQVIDSEDVEVVNVPVLLPHEILDAVARAGPEQVQLYVYGSQWELVRVSKQNVLELGAPGSF